jgi:hypothetical protein
MAARKDYAFQAFGHFFTNEVVGHIVGMDLAIDLRFTYAPGDELGDLRAEVEDQDSIVHAYSIR